MNATEFFVQGYAFTGTWDDYLVIPIVLLSAILGVLLFRERPKHAAMVHSPPMAWLRAGLYFCFIFIFSWVSGVIKVIATTPFVTAEQAGNPVWNGYFALCCVVVVWAYVYWWPRGTLTHGRKLFLIPTVLYGLAWGISSGLMMLSLYALIEKFQLPGLANAVILIVLLSIYNMNYQLGWWDQHVSPPHNLKSTNNGKVLLAHNPFLLASLSFFVIYGNAGIFVLLSSAAMCASAIALRFPPFWQKDGSKVSLDTAIGE